MEIRGREISSKLPPYLVAEIGGNHGGSIWVAKQLITEAYNAGADAVKLQCFEPGRLTLDCDKPDFILKDGPWKGRKLYDLYKATETPRAWFPALFQHGKEIGITVFSSVFSEADVDFLETLDCPVYKIASMEITDINLIAHAAKTGKPLIISTGMASKDEILAAISIARNSTNLTLLYCVSGYPTPIEESNIWWAKNYWEHHFMEYFGLSDHTIGCDVAIAATALGAVMIEKHLAMPDVETEDSGFSMMPQEFHDMSLRVKAIWKAMHPSERKSEGPSRQLRRSLYVVKDIKSGEAFTTENVRSIRPSYGLPPKELERVLKSVAACDIEQGTALREEHIYV